MVDNINPNSQFHPYQPMNATPMSDKMTGGLKDMVSSAQSSLKNLNAKNPSVVLGGLAALAIGMGLMRRRR